MSFRIQRRANLSKGLGLNISASGVSPSWRTKFGSLGSRGFSIRTGIPGISYRSAFSGRKSKNGLIETLVILIFAVSVGAALLIVWNVLRFIVWGITELFKAVARLFIKPQAHAIDNDPDDKANYLFTENSIPNQFHGSPMHVSRWLVPNGSMVVAGTEVLEISVAGITAKSHAKGSGIVEHNKAEGEELQFGDTLFTLDRSVLRQEV
jgi:hypothetical protein